MKVVDLWNVGRSVALNYAEGLVELDKDNNFVPCLAESWQWIDERTIEFKLRKGVSFHNGESFSAEVVKINWEAYNKLKPPMFPAVLSIDDGTVLEIVDINIVRFIFPELTAWHCRDFGGFFSLRPPFLTGMSSANGAGGISQSLDHGGRVPSYWLREP